LVHHHAWVRRACISEGVSAVWKRIDSALLKFELCSVPGRYPIDVPNPAKARTFLPVHIGGKETEQAATKERRKCHRTQTHLPTEHAMEELQKLSVVNKLCVELTNHLGVADKTLGEFIYSLAYDKEGTLVGEDVFAERLAHNGADSFSPELVEALFNAISVMSSGTEVNFLFTFLFSLARFDEQTTFTSGPLRSVMFVYTRLLSTYSFLIFIFHLFS